MPTTARRTSNYTLTVPAPEHHDADLHAALDALIQAAGTAGVEVSDSTFSRDPRTLSVSYRVADDGTARETGLRVLSLYGAVDLARTPAHLHTGYGIHRREFPLEA